MNFGKMRQRPIDYAYVPKYSSWIFVVVIVSISFFYSYQDIVFYPAQGIHLWRQCDCLSQAMNYFQDDLPFFAPAVHNLGGDGTGKAVSDFPLIYYVVGNIWQITGHHESVFRMINLLLFFAGMFALFKTLERILKDSFFAIFIVALLFSAPFLVYYANNFLMDVPAFSLALIGMFCFMRFYYDGKLSGLYLFALSFCLAGLLKISALLGFMAVLCLFILEMAGVKMKPKGKLFLRPLHHSLPFVLVFVVQLAWFFWLKHYNATFNAGIFLTGISPVWQLDQEQIVVVFEYIIERFRWDYFRPLTSVFLVGAFFATLVFYKKTNKLLLFLLGLLFAGSVAFCVLFFQALKHHDYYVINLLILVPVVLLSFLWMLKQRFPRIYKSLFFRILLIALLVHSIDFARRRIEGRYDPQGWQNESYSTTLVHFTEISPYLRTLGIAPNDKVIVLPDPSVNVSLYLMNQKGWTNYNVISDSLRIQKKWIWELSIYSFTIRMKY